MPNLAVIEELRKNGDVELLYIGAAGGVEKKMMEKSGVDFRAVSCGKWRRYFSLENFSDLFKTPLGVWQAWKVLRKFRPDVVFSKGGFVSVPVVVAASLIGVPIILHESDVVPGLANKICARYADKICLSFEESRKYLEKFGERLVVTGNPVRSFLADGDREKAYKFTGLDKHRPVILVMGGSQGAEQINQLVRAGLEELLKRFQIVHIRGRGNLDISLKKKGYVQYEYLEQQMADIYAMCEMVVSRGGANSLAEIAFLKKRALIIPLGTEASRGDQIENAKVFVRKFGWGMLGGDISGEDFVKGVEMAYENEFSGEEFEDGTGKIVELIVGLCKK